MSIQKRLRGMVLVVAMSFVAYVAYADSVTVSTYYPSPYGIYQNLTTTAQTNLATTAGNVVIGGAGAGAAKLDVTGNARITTNLAVNGNTTLGNAAADTTTVSGPLTVYSTVTSSSGVLQVDCSSVPGKCYPVYA